MKYTIPTDARAFNQFIKEEKDKVHAYLRKTFSLSDDKCDDIYQEASIALYINITEGKLKTLTSTLSTYFLRICINQALNYTASHKKTVPLINESNLSDQECFLDDKLAELYSICTKEDEYYSSRADRIVDYILQDLPETCKNIFTSYYWNNLSTKVIAEIFGYANANTVKAQKYKCVNKFRCKFNDLMSKEDEY